MFSVAVFTLSKVTQLFDFLLEIIYLIGRTNSMAPRRLSDKRDSHRGILVHTVKGKGAIARVALLIGV